MAKKNNTGRNAIIIVLVLIVALFVSVNRGWIDNPLAGAQQSAIGEDAVIITDCNTAPTITESAVDALSKGTSLSPDYQYRVNGVLFSSEPTLNAGQKVQIIANLSSHIDKISEEIVVKCGGNPINFELFDYDAPTLEIKEDSTVLTDSATGGASNASAIGLGGSDTYKVVLTGTDESSTGDLVYVIEVNANANVSTINMYDASGNTLEEVSIPSFYTNTLSSPFRKAFKIPQILGAVEKEYSLTMVAKSGKDIFGAVYTTAYVGQAYVETDGTFVNYGVENTDGTTKYEATFDYDFYIAQ